MLAVDELLHRPIRISDAIVHCLWVDVGVERVVDELHRVVHILFAVRRQISELSADDGADDADEGQHTEDDRKDDR